MNIVLIGLRGSGKSAIGKRLSNLLCRTYRDSDEEIEKNAGGTIAELVAKKGWDFFRQKEHEVVQDIFAHAENAIISLGGGTVVDVRNKELIKNKSNLIILLKADIEFCLTNSSGGNRPQIIPGMSAPEEMEFIWNERKELYESYADLTFDMRGRSMDKEFDLNSKSLQIAKQILDLQYPGYMHVATVGYPVCKSKSPAIHNTGIETYDIPAHFELINLPTATLLPEVKKMNFHGFSVTVPYKEDVLPLLDYVSPEVEKIGACNTVKNVDGKWYGYNTDYYGIEMALRDVTNPNNKRIALLGAGGAAHAIAYALHMIGCDVVMYNRTVEKAKVIADTYGFRAESTKHFGKFNYDIVINATTIDEPVDLTKLLEGKVVVDINYQSESKLLLEARKKNCHTLDGLPMLIYQAVKQFHIWFDKDLPLELIKQALL